MKYFLGLSSTYSLSDTLRHTFATGDEYNLSELRAFLAAHYGATYDHVAVYQNGRTALEVAIKAVTKRGSKIIITSLTCYAVVQAVKAADCVPVFADVDPKTLHFGKAELEKALEGEENVSAVIVQNNLGIPADIAGIEEVAKAHKLVIIEDLAHCAGMKYADGREAGTVGRAAALSFGKGKSIDTITGGAVIFTNSLDSPVEQPEKTPPFKEIFCARMYPLFSLIIRGCYSIHPKVGKYLTAALVRMHAIRRSADGDINPNIRLPFWQCKLALLQLKTVSHARRKPLRDFYLVNNRDALLAKLEDKGFFFREIWYDIPVAPERYFKKVDFHPEECPVATRIAAQIVNLPTHYQKSELKPALELIEKCQISDTESVAKTSLTEELMTEAEKKAKIKAEKKQRKKAKKTKKSAEEKTVEQKSTSGEKPAEEKSPDEKPAETNATEITPVDEKPAEKSLAAEKPTAAEKFDRPKAPAKGNAIMRQAPRKLTDREKLKLELESGKKEGPSVI